MTNGFKGLARRISLCGFLLATSSCTLLGVPDVASLKTQYPVVVYHPAKSANAKSSFRVKIQRSRPADWVDYSSISHEAVGAIVVSEDWAFFSHKGYDPNQIREAVKEAVEDGHRLRGASTITQQVAKNVFLDADRNLVRKVKELAIAVRLEEKLSKRRILEIYLNIAEWGEGIFGIGPAARRYFHKSPSELTAKEGAFLAMLLPSPKRYAQSFRSHKLTPYARETIESILEKMHRAKYLDDAGLSTELATPLSFEVTETPPRENLDGGSLNPSLDL